LKSEGLVGLVNLEASHQLCDLPSSVAKRGLMKALVLVGAACEDQSSREQYWSRVLKPLHDRFISIVQAPDFKKNYNDDNTRARVESLLESFIG